MTYRQQAGYIWARNALLSGELSRAEIEDLCSSMGIDADDFDAGARQALKDTPEEK